MVSVLSYCNTTYLPKRLDFGTGSSSRTASQPQAVAAGRIRKPRAKGGNLPPASQSFCVGGIVVAGDQKPSCDDCQRVWRAVSLG